VTLSNRFLYPLELSLKEKIETICKEMYGADGVEYTEQAEQRLQSYSAAGYDKLPICMAKTQYSLSTNAAAKGVPTGFTITVRGPLHSLPFSLSYSSFPQAIEDDSLSTISSLSLPPSLHLPLSMSLFLTYFLCLYFFHSLTLFVF
jgi:hypothetical protein